MSELNCGLIKLLQKQTGAFFASPCICKYTKHMIGRLNFSYATSSKILLSCVPEMSTVQLLNQQKNHSSFSSV